MKQSLLDHDRLAVLGRTLAILAHEGRGLLSVSCLTLDLLTLSLEDRPEMMSLASSIQSAHARLRRLFDDVYGYAAPIKLKLERCNLRERSLSVCEDLRKLDSSKHIEVIEPLGESDFCCRPIHSVSIRPSGTWCRTRWRQVRIQFGSPPAGQQPNCMAPRRCE